MEITDLIKDAVQGVKSVLDVNRVIGEPIRYAGYLILPITKMTIGFASGGGEMEGKSTLKTKELPVGGVGGGANIYPIGFLIIDDGNVKYIKTEGGETWLECLEKVFQSFS